MKKGPFLHTPLTGHQGHYDDDSNDDDDGGGDVYEMLERMP